MHPSGTPPLRNQIVVSGQNGAHRPAPNPEGPQLTATHREGNVRRLTILAAALAITGPLLAPTPIRAAFPGANGRIAVVIEGNGTSIATMAPDGSDLEVLISAAPPQAVAAPEWSPGGKYILYERHVADQSDIWRMNADGTGQRRLTWHAGNDQGPTWAPDGSRFAFASNRSSDVEIYTMSVDGGDLRRLTTNPGFDIDPAWSPENDRIAFVSDRHGPREIHLMQTDGTDVERVSTAEGDEERHSAPEWSPDGARLSFSTIGFDVSYSVDEITVATGSTRHIPLESCVPLYTGDNRGGHYAPDPSSPVPDAMVYTFESAEANSDICLISTSTDGDPIRLTVTDEPNWNAAGWQPIPDFPLVDARFSTFKADIEWVYDAGITVGCSVERYCPDTAVTREQLASFLVRALGLTGTPPDAFTDDDTSIHENNINLLAAAGVTTGCGPGLFCPKQVVKRDQVASFLARALDLPATGTDYFTDDESNTHEVDINRLRSAGITSGCTATTYCPAGVVTRGQMAAFLHRGFD